MLRGLQTLHVRMDRHSATALALARQLESGPGVVRVVDVAPTVLSLLGVPVPDSMEGAPIALGPAPAAEAQP